jgi:hypothetical protein
MSNDVALFCMADFSLSSIPTFLLRLACYSCNGPKDSV